MKNTKAKKQIYVLKKLKGVMRLKFRHEWKHEISYTDMLLLESRLPFVAKRDEHAADGKYFIRSLYFDNASDKALREKIDGVNIREKFRIRYYNKDTSIIHLEKKSKMNGLCNKQSVELSAEQAQRIVDGDWSWMTASDKPLITELYSKMKSQGLRPKTIVDYTREAFVYAPGNVRVTLDYDIRTGLGCTDFLNPECVTVPASEPLIKNIPVKLDLEDTNVVSKENSMVIQDSCIQNAEKEILYTKQGVEECKIEKCRIAVSPPIILEVKWDEFLPDIIRDAVQLPNCRSNAFSKYAVCRKYG